MGGLTGEHPRNSDAAERRLEDRVRVEQWHFDGDPPFSPVVSLRFSPRDTMIPTHQRDCIAEFGFGGLTTGERTPRNADVFTSLLRADR